MWIWYKVCFYKREQARTSPIPNFLYILLLKTYMRHLICILWWVLIIWVDAWSHSSDILGEISSCSLCWIGSSALLASWRDSVLVRGRPSFGTTHTHLGLTEHSGLGCVAAERGWWWLVYWKIVLNNGCSWGVQDLVGDVFEGAIYRETPVLNLLVGLLLVYNHGRLQVMVVGLVAQSTDASRLVHSHPFGSLLLAIIIAWLLATHLWNLRAPVSSSSISGIAPVDPSSPMLRHVQMVGPEPNLWVPCCDIHTLSPIDEVRCIDILILGLVIDTSGTGGGGPVTTRASAPDPLEHLLFLSDARANVVDDTVNSADPLQLTRWVWYTGARSAHLLLRLWIIPTC